MRPELWGLVGAVVEWLGRCQIDAQVELIFGGWILRVMQRIRLVATDQKRSERWTLDVGTLAIKAQRDDKYFF